MKPKELWTGKQLFSLLVPERINLRGHHRCVLHLHDEFAHVRSTHSDKRTGELFDEDTVVLVENGQLLAGIVCKNTIGAKAGGFIHTIR